MTPNEQSPSSAITARFFWLVLGLTLLVAVAKRLMVMDGPGFPLGEGGLFVLFSETILANGFALPHQVVYGGVTLPFAYPPAGFYFAAAVSRITGAELLDVYYWLPITLNLLAVPAFCFLAAQLTRDRLVFLCAAILYVQMPESYIWQITGGGLPRAFAALFALIAVGLALRVTATGSKTLLVLSAVCIGVAILSHLEWGIFATVGVTLAYLSRARFRNAALLTAAAGLVSFLVILPWLGAVLAGHGLDPFLSSSSSSAWNLGSFLSTTVRGRMFGIVIWPAILGVIVTIYRRDWFLIVWVVLSVLLTPRMGASSGFGIPAAILAGYGFKAAGEFVYDLLTSHSLLRGTTSQPGRRPPLKVALTLLPLLFYSFIFVTPIPTIFHRPAVIEQVGPGSREAMRWIAKRTDPHATFFVMSGAEEWYLDRIAEWFPYLTARGSVTTAQGLEWAGPGVFEKKTREISGLKLAQAGAPELMPAFMEERYCVADHVALFAASDTAERQSFLRSPAFQPVFANDEALVLRRRVPSIDCKPGPAPQGAVTGSARNAEAS